MARKQRQRVQWGVLCPTNEAHGPMLGYEDGYHCPNAEHPRSSPPTKSWWKPDEVGAAQEVPA